MATSIPAGSSNKFFGQKVSKQGVNVYNASDSDLIYKNDYSSTLYYNNAGVPTVLLGKRYTSPVQQGLFVSKSGVDVTKASDEELIFSTNFYLENVVLKDQLTTTPQSANSTNTYNYIHGLGQIPVVAAWYEYNQNQYVQLPYTNYNSGLGVSWNVSLSYLDKTTMVFTIQTGPVSLIAGAIYFTLSTTPLLMID